jgi:hypothetical protein
MLLHLPIAIMAALSPITVSDTVPQFDIARECRFEGGAIATFDRCAQDEAAALSELKTRWTTFSSTDQKTCMAMTTTGGFASNVELLTCLEMAGGVASANNDPRGATDEVRSRARPRSASTLRGRFQARAAHGRARHVLNL